jgi:anti-sigma B factor antagonist
MVLRIETKPIEPDIVVMVVSGSLALVAKSLHGQLDHAEPVFEEGSWQYKQEAGRLETALEEVIAAGPLRVMILDLAAVDYIDSTGLRILINCFKRAQAAGIALRVAGATGRVQKLLKVTRLETFFPFFDTVQEACREPKETEGENSPPR